MDSYYIYKHMVYVYVSGFCCSTLCLRGSSILFSVTIVCCFSLLCSVSLSEYTHFICHSIALGLFGLFPGSGSHEYCCEEHLCTYQWSVVMTLRDYHALSPAWNWSALEESLDILLPGHRGTWLTFLLKPLAETFFPEIPSWSCPLWNNNFELLFFKVLSFLLISNATSRSVQEKKTKDSNPVLSCETVS